MFASRTRLPPVLPKQVALGAFLLAAACSSPRSAQTAGVPHLTKPAAPSSTCLAARRTPLYYEVQGTPTRLAFVHASVNGTPPVLLLDSGATDQALARWFAQQLHVETYSDTADVTIDHDGNRIVAQRARGVGLSLEGWGDVKADSATLVIDVPAVFADHGIGGILAPQLLRSAGQSLAIDLAGGFLSLEPSECTTRQRRALRDCEFSPEALPTCAPGSKGIGPLFALPAVVGGVAASLVVDTGARETDLFVSSVAGRQLDGDPSRTPTTGYVASGDSPGFQVASVVITAGTCHFDGSVTLTSGASGNQCPRDGVLGIDLLRACELVVDDRGLSGTCGGAPTPLGR